MSKLDEIYFWHKTIKEIDPANEAEMINAKFSFEKALLSSSDLDVIDFQYSCLGDHDHKWIHLTCRAAFSKRRDIESYLFEKLSSETDTLKKADIIHILGRLRSNAALPLALENLIDSSNYMREICLYVIGWTGGVEEVKVLASHLINETTQKLKITAGSALRQIAWRIPDEKKLIVLALKSAFYSESDRLVIARIIELASTITVKNLGIREDKNNPDVLLGDIDKAIKKADKYFSTEFL